MGALDGKVAIVTGAGRGVGRGTALSLARHGATVVVADIGVEMDGSQPRNTEADGVVAEIKAGGGNASASYTDVANFQQVEAMVAGQEKNASEWHEDVMWRESRRRKRKRTTIPMRIAWMKASSSNT